MKKLIYLLLFFIVFLSEAYAALPKPLWGFKEANYCSNSECPIGVCEGSLGDANYGGGINAWSGNWYLYGNLDSLDGLVIESNGCAKFIIDRTPTFYFSDDTSGEASNIYYDFTVDDTYNFSSPVIRYCSGKVSASDGNASNLADWSFTVDQAEGSGTYFAGDSATDLPVYGTTKTFYWRARVCTDSACSTGCSNYLYSGGDSSNSSCSEGVDYGFAYAPYFINANTTEGFYTSVGSITKASATIKFATPHHIDYQIKYGTSSDLTGGAFTIEKENQTGALSETIYGLSEGTKYYYQLYACENNCDPDGGGNQKGSIKSFTTAQPEGKSFKFVITADLHTVRETYFDSSTSYNHSIPELKNTLEATNSSFWLDMGDFMETDFEVPWTQDHTDGLYLLMVNGLNHIAGSLPFVSVIGNHEMQNQYYGTYPYGIHQSRCQQTVAYGFFNYIGLARQKFLLLYSVDLSDQATPYYSSYYSFDYGDARFIILDGSSYTTQFPVYCDGNTGANDGFTLGSAQREWLYKQVRSNTLRWTLIFIHSLGGNISGITGTGDVNLPECYGRGGILAADQSKLYKEIAGVVEHRRNTVLFYGHDHVFATGLLRGLRFVSCPGVAMFADQWAYDDSYGYHDVQWLYEPQRGDWNGTIYSINAFTGAIYCKPQSGTRLSVGDNVRNVTKNISRRVITVTSQHSFSIYDDIYNTDPEIQYSLSYNSLLDWNVGDKLYLHKPAKGFLTVDVNPFNIIINMLSLSDGSQVVYPTNADDAYTNDGEPVRIVIPADSL